MPCVDWLNTCHVLIGFLSQILSCRMSLQRPALSLGINQDSALELEITSVDSLEQCGGGICF